MFELTKDEFDLILQHGSLIWDGIRKLSYTFTL